MPIHDWTRAPSGYFHHFHQYWTVGICTALNAGLLPKGIFALVEQYSGAKVPDVLALETEPLQDRDFSSSRGGVALATEPPKTRFVSRADEEIVYAAKANRVALHREDETIAVIEIVSPGNKASQLALRQFVEKSLEPLERGIHLKLGGSMPTVNDSIKAIMPTSFETRQWPRWPATTTASDSHRASAPR